MFDELCGRVTTVSTKTLNTLSPHSCLNWSFPIVLPYLSVMSCLYLTSHSYSLTVAGSWKHLSKTRKPFILLHKIYTPLVLNKDFELIDTFLFLKGKHVQTITGILGDTYFKSTSMFAGLVNRETHSDDFLIVFFYVPYIM